MTAMPNTKQVLSPQRLTNSSNTRSPMPFRSLVTAMSRFDATTKACRLHSANTRYLSLLPQYQNGSDSDQNVADAQRAITCGRGMEVDGRACRTEVAKVNRKHKNYLLLVSQLTLCRFFVPLQSYRRADRRA